MRARMYFPHDFNARGDMDIIPLLQEMGWEGYGLFWALVEMLYEHNGAMQMDYNSIAYALHTDAGRIEGMVAKYGLFYTENGMIKSHSVDRRMAEINAKNEQKRAAAKARWAKESDADAMHHYANKEINKEINTRKKRKNIYKKEKQEGEGEPPAPPTPTPQDDAITPGTAPEAGGVITLPARDVPKPQEAAKRFKPPTLEEVSAYCQERKNRVNPQKWMDHYQAKGWKVGKTPMKDWKAAIRTWEHNEDPAPPSPPSYPETSLEQQLDQWEGEEAPPCMR